MKVLWITNILLPEANGLITGNNEFKGSGGWLVGAAHGLLKTNNVQLSIAAPSPLVTSLKVLQGEAITYFAIPKPRSIHGFIKDSEGLWREIHNQVQPDIVHIHGTEFPYGLAYIRACGASHVVASIQGMMSVIYKYNICDIPHTTLLKNTTLSDVLLRKTLWKEKKDLNSYGQYEVQLIKGISHVIGRTSWDRAHTWAINSNVRYHFCNETLRAEFYTGHWDSNKCSKHTIFVSQLKNSIKGFHQLLKALPLVLAKYPDTIVRIPGNLQLFPTSLKGKMLQGGYERYLRQLIEKYNIKKQLVFLGPLSAEEMKREYLSANVFVSCSSIENSSNSIGEAQMLGTPCISSYVGGCSDMIRHGETGFLYRFEEIEMLAYYICHIFGSKINLIKMSDDEAVIARKRHDPHANSEALLDIYKKVISDDE